MRKTTTLLTLLAFAILSALNDTLATERPPQAAASSSIDYEVCLSILQMDLPFEIEYNPTVEEHLKGYLFRGRHETRKMLSRAAMYFPIFEYYLQKNGLPDELKYIPLLESRLRPTAESSAGAAGLWQFMPVAAEHYKLQINDYVDERLNPFRATEGAVKMLGQLYQEFGDWALALAAYNCGPGRVRRALKQSGCDSFWDIAHLLPRQTRAYLPALIATIYVGKNHAAHGLTPSFNNSHQRLFRVFRINGSLQLTDIASNCQVSMEELLRLNPGYLEDFVPAQPKGHYLILPETAFGKFQQYVIKESRRGNGSYAVAVLESKARKRDAAAL